MAVEQPIIESLSTSTSAGGASTHVAPAPSGVVLYDTLMVIFKTNGTKKIDAAGWAGFDEVLNQTSSGSIGYGVKTADASDVSLSAALGNYTFTFDTTSGNCALTVLRISGARRVAPASVNSTDNGQYTITPYNAPALDLTHENSLIIRVAPSAGPGAAATVNWADAILNTHEIADFQNGTSSGMSVSWEDYPGSLSAVQRQWTWSITPTAGHWNGLTIQVISNVERSSPNAIEAATNLTGAVTLIDEDYDVDGGDWITSPAIQATQSKTWYMMGGTLQNGFQPTQENGSAPADAAFATATGWIVGAIAAGNYAGMRANTERATGALTASVQPQTEGLVTGAAGNAFRSPSAYDGDFDAGNWTLDAIMRSVTAAMPAGHTAALRWRVYASTNADGSGARQLTTGDIQSGTVGGTGNTTANHLIRSAVWAAPLVELRNEYLFFVCAVRIVALSGTGNTRDLNFRQNTNSKIVAPTFRPKEPDGSIRVSFPTPSTAPSPGADLGRVATRMRKKGVGLPTADVVLVEGGVDRASLSYNIGTLDPGEIHDTVFFDPSTFSDPTGAGMEVRIDTTNVGGGSVEIGAIQLMYAIPRDVAGAAIARSEGYGRALASRQRTSKGSGASRTLGTALGSRERLGRAYGRSYALQPANRAVAMLAGRAYGSSRSSGRGRGGVVFSSRANGYSSSNGRARSLRDRPGGAFGRSDSRGVARAVAIVLARARGASTTSGLARGGRISTSRAYGRAESFGHTEFARIVNEIEGVAYGVARSRGYARATRVLDSAAYARVETAGVAHPTREVASGAYAIATSSGWAIFTELPPTPDAIPVAEAWLEAIALGQVELVPIAEGVVQLVPIAGAEVGLEPIPESEVEWMSSTSE